ncbi:hypothetical protein DY000_02017982 [Brassica cretica]|uniref:Uncharacterized protein n=1 Tax=Brassica cretica TaxID=69181 RepID=A0ABQ7CYH5_BRACR|nr:hypothetical protein DY000_02017982 [Brassica cretica]
MASCIQSQSICVKIKADFFFDEFAASVSRVRGSSAETLCGCLLQHGLRNTDNVLDAFQLALLCDFPRLSVISHHMIMKHFKELCATGAWIFMQSRPFLEKKNLEGSVIIEESGAHGVLQKWNKIEARLKATSHF